ncbi:MAG: hypothetical protein JWM68_2508 [Verrucomicrobiales bacterium]|nr:hypothetical protein [Verrucomicrobiales bacterium]
MKTMLKKTVGFIWKYFTWNNCAILAATILVLDACRDPRSLAHSLPSKYRFAKILTVFGWGFLGGMSFVLSLYKYWDHDRVKSFGLSVRHPKKIPTFFGTPVGATILFRRLGYKDPPCFKILSLDKFRVRYCPVENPSMVFDVDQKVFAHRGWEVMPVLCRYLEPGDVVKFLVAGYDVYHIVIRNDKVLESIHFRNKDHYGYETEVEVLPYDLFDRLNWTFQDRIGKEIFEKVHAPIYVANERV